MKRALCAFVLYRLMGWSARVERPTAPKYVVCIAPHTSNWDFIIGKLCSCIFDLKMQYLMKKEWFFWPLGILFRRTGGIPVERSRHHSLVDQLSEHALRSEQFHLAITPEGTRSANPHWKRGFYYIALKAGIPIVLVAFDYRTRTVVCERQIIPNGDVEGQMRQIKEYYTQFAGKHRHKFAT